MAQDNRNRTQPGDRHRQMPGGTQGPRSPQDGDPTHRGAIGDQGSGRQPTNDPQRPREEPVDVDESDDLDEDRDETRDPMNPGTPRR